MCDITVFYKIASIAWCKTGHRPNGWQLIKLGQPSFCRSKIYKTSSKLYCLACMVRHHQAPETIEIYITAPSSTQKYKYIYIYIYTRTANHQKMRICFMASSNTECNVYRYIYYVLWYACRNPRALKHATTLPRRTEGAATWNPRWSWQKCIKQPWAKLCLSCVQCNTYACTLHTAIQDIHTLMLGINIDHAYKMNDLSYTK